MHKKSGDASDKMSGDGSDTEDPRPGEQTERSSQRSPQQADKVELGQSDIH